MDNDNKKIYQASDKVKDKILEKREYVKSVLEICNDIIDGKPMSVACREHNIKFDRFRTFIERDWCFEEEIIFNDDYEPTINPTWQDALFAALFGKSNKKAYINKDYQENFDYALSMLSDKEEDIIRKVFIDNLSCREVAEELGSSLGGIQSRFNIALRRLRHPSIAKYLVYGYDLSNEYCKIEEELNQKKEELQNLIDQKKDELAVVNEQIALINNIENNRSQAQKNSGYHYLRACRPIFSC